MQIMLEDIKKMIQEELQHINEFDHDGEKVVQLLKEICFAFRKFLIHRIQLPLSQ